MCALKRGLRVLERAPAGAAMANSSLTSASLLELLGPAKGGAPAQVDIHLPSRYVARALALAESRGLELEVVMTAAISAGGGI